ncbi:MAG: NAD(P)-dependent dehydrogenase, short-chain alcohol dehydrogenase family [Marmoricola sp.]|nr:NAD(P)-dependent dehydrogenase, short-chain alcohol dehydrogenase family [Marmoricola sp.]
MSPDTASGEGLVDRLLDRTLVLGYTTIGYRLRRARWDGNDPEPGALIGRRALVTGAGSGLGEATAMGLAALGATVHLLGRTRQRVQPAAERIAAAIGEGGWAGSVQTESCDVSDLDDVRRFGTELASRLVARGDVLDIIVHNAGVLPAERVTNAQGHELAVATHVLGPVLMTDLLVPALASGTRSPRVIFVSSGGMYTQSLPVDDPDFTRGRYRGSTAYARSKRIQVELIADLARRWDRAGVKVSAMHPGWADTPGVASSLPVFRALTRPLLRSAEEGADTVVWLSAVRPAPATGGFWHDRVRRPTSYRSATEPSDDEVARTWAWVREAVGF